MPEKERYEHLKVVFERHYGGIQSVIVELGKFIEAAEKCGDVPRQSIKLLRKVLEIKFLIHHRTSNMCWNFDLSSFSFSFRVGSWRSCSRDLSRKEIYGILTVKVQQVC